MRAGDEIQRSLAELRELAQLPDHQFASRTPVLGRLIAAFRTAWNNVSTRWYVQPALQQQTQFNQLSVDKFGTLQIVLDDVRRDLAALAALPAVLDDVRRSVAALHEWVIAQDREQTEHSHDLGELASELGQLRRRVDLLPSTTADATAGTYSEEDP